MAWTTQDEIEWNRTNPFRQNFDLQVEWVSDDGRAEVSLAVTENLLQAYGVAHGGVYCVLIDTVLGTAVRAALQYDAQPATIDLNVSFLRPTGLGRVFARGEIVKAGKSVVVGTADVLDADGRKLATGRASFMVRPAA